MEKQRDGRVDFLDFMRVFAFSSVLIAHIFHQGLYNASVNANLHLTVRMLAGLIYDTCFAGAAGVVVFFITSGYIITHVLQKEKFIEFGIKRVFRIYPLYIFAVILELSINSYHGAELPPMSVVVPRLLLLGDVFHTPYALGGVEWTLRVEVMFYVFMGFLRLTGALNFSRVLPLLYLGIALFLYNVHPFPRFAGWTDGYLGIYGPYLFIGSIVYLYEKKLSSLAVSAISIICMMAIFLIYTAEIKVVLKETNHGIVALSIFLTAWFYRERFVSGTLVRTLSEMTYAIYLLHLTLWKPLADIGASYGPSFINADLQALVMLLAICFLLCKTVEKQGVAIGRSVVNMVYRHGSTRGAVAV